MGVFRPPEWQCNPANIKRIAVMHGGVLYVLEHSDPRLHTLGSPVACIPLSTDIAELAGLAISAGCGAVWWLDARPPNLSFDADDPYYVWHEISSDGAVAGLVAQVRGADNKGHGVPLGIYAPRVNDAWGVSAALDKEAFRGNVAARTFGEAMALAAYSLGQQLRFSPSYTGNAMLRTELAAYERRTGKRIPPLSPQWREACYALRPSPMQRRRPIPTPLYDAPVRIHIYDRNMSYVSSAREVPIGDPLEDNDFWPHRPGFYQLANGKTYWEPELRDALSVYIPEHATKIIARMRARHFWPKGQTIDLRPWSNRIWAARQTCHAIGGPAGRIAEALVKRVGVSTIGRLIQHTGRAVMTSERAREDGARVLSYESDDAGELTGNVEAETRIGRDDLVCPHWWATIISNANERLEHAINRYAREDTVLAYVDQFYCVERHPELEGDPMKPGGWKYSGDFLIPQADIDGLNAPEVDAQALVKRFAAYQRAREQDMELTAPVKYLVNRRTAM